MRTVYVISRLLCVAVLTLAFAQRVYTQDPSEDDTPPSIDVHPLTVNVDARKPIRLECRAVGLPEPTYYWKKDGALFELDANSRATLDGGTLIINSPESTDNGDYQCFANNRLGTAMSDKVTARVAYMNQFRDTQPTTIDVKHGQPLKIRCGMAYGPPDGIPQPYIYWSDAAEKPAPIEYNARVNQDLDGNLVFSNVNASDAKGYFCTAMNHVVGLSQRSPRVDLNVDTTTPAVPVAAALAAKPAASVTAIRTEELKLKCIANGYPTPSIIWKREGDQLPSGGRLIVDPTGQGLTISNVEFGDAGQYSCEATNSAGSDSATTVVTVEAAPYFSNPPSDETKGPGEMVTIQCRADGMPVPEVNWLVNGQPWVDFAATYETGNRWTVATGRPRVASIEIRDLVTTDSNVFQCLATNKYKDSLTSVVLNVVSIPAAILEFTPQSHELIVQESDSATFICHAIGRPSPTIVWTFKNTALTTGAKYTVDDVEGRLIVNDVNDADSGRYQCTVTNSIDGEVHEADDDADLIVLARTTISTPPEDLTVREGDEATFQCEIASDPDLDSLPVIHWLKDGQRLEANNDGSLVILRTQITSSGTYMCVVETTVDASSGSVQVVNSTAVLTVRGRPSPPENVVLNAQEQQFVYRLTWTPGNSNNAPIQRYIIMEKADFEDMDWTEKEEVDAADESYIYVLHLDPYVMYSYEVIAVNELGRSDPSERISLTDKTAAAAPVKNPEDVRGTSTDPNFMVIRWTTIHPYYYGGDEFRYVVKYWKVGSTNRTEKEVSEHNHLIVPASKPYEAFEFTVQSKNDIGEGPIPTASTGYSGQAAPGSAPSGVTVESISANEVNVTWQPIPEEDSNGVLLGYHVNYNQRIASGQDRETCPTSPCVVGNLEAFSTYEISVSAYTSQGIGPASDPVVIKTMASEPGPVDLKVEAYSERIVLEWHPPILPNGDLIGYKISIAPMTETNEKLGEIINLTRAVGEPLYMRVKEEIEPATRYHISVVAYNNVGDGDKTTSEPITLNGGRPAKPDSPTVKAIGTDHANVTWDVTGLNPSPNLVSVEYKKTSDDANDYQETKQVDVLDETEIMVTGLDELTSYHFRLRVLNSAGATHGPDTTSKTAGTGEATAAGFVMGTWMIALICIIILLILILLIICIIKSQKGGKYNVSDKEKQLKNDIESTPLKDDGAFDEYKPPTGADGEPLRGSQGSLVDSEPGSSESDSLKEYADGETGKFDEEGSFIGQYGDNKKQRPADDGEQGGAAYSTFV